MYRDLWFSTNGYLTQPKELVVGPDYLVNQAIDQLLELHNWQRERVKAGIKAADEGRFASGAEMTKIFSKYANV